MSKNDLDNYEYDDYLVKKAKRSRSARHELERRRVERARAHDADGVGWHFNLDTKPVRIRSKEHLKEELERRGLMLGAEVRGDK